MNGLDSGNTLVLVMVNRDTPHSRRDCCLTYLVKCFGAGRCRTQVLSFVASMLSYGCIDHDAKA